jgi:hypothetical protein
MRYGVLTQDADENFRVTIVDDIDTANRLCGRIDAAGGDAKKIVRVVSEADAKV